MSMRSSVRVCSAVLYKAQGKNVAIEIELSSLILGPLVFDAAFSNAFFKISEKKKYLLVLAQTSFGHSTTICSL